MANVTVPLGFLTFFYVVQVAGNYSAIAIRHLPSYNDRMVLMALSCD